MSSQKVKDTRSRVLQATWELMEEHEGHGVAMADIAKRAGLSRQAVYLHFPNRAELLIAATWYVDEALDLPAKLRPMQAATTGAERLDRLIAAWGGHLPGIHGVTTAMLRMKADDADAATAWADRMNDIREACSRTVAMLASEDRLRPGWSKRAATDVLAMLLSVENWQRLTREDGWSNTTYIKRMKQIAHDLLVVKSDPD